MDIKNKLKILPASPGVYIMKDTAGRVIYIGKAADLRKRVYSYFHKAKGSYKTDVLVSNIADIDYVPVSCEEEALLLEAALVREKQPKFNVMLKDDKRYPLLKLTLEEEFPRLVIARRKRPDGGMYFGPYTSAKLLRRALAILRRLFVLRACKPGQKAPCLYYHIGQCAGPCAGRIDKDRYMRVVEDLKLFLKGRKTELIGSIAERMKKAAAERRFEEASRLRDQIEALCSVRTTPHQGGTGKSRLSKQDTAIPGQPFVSVFELQSVLGLSKAPVRIEAFDISALSGKEAVGSMVSFNAGRQDKSCYRRFKVRTVFECDDYKMIEEVVRRRYAGSLSRELPLPDLVVIDGGKGHVNTAKRALDELRLGEVPVIGIAKKEEEVFLPRLSGPIALPSGSKALQLIQCIRDEAHRFAQAYHHALRRKKIIGK